MTLDLEELISESQLFLAILLLLQNSSIFVAKMNVISKRGEDISSARDSWGKNRYKADQNNGS